MKRFYHCFYTEMPDQFVAANVDRLKKFAARWADYKGYLPRFEMIDGLSVHLQGNPKTTKWPTMMADSAAQMHAWMMKKGDRYDGRYWESLEEDQRSPDRKSGDAGGDDPFADFTSGLAASGARNALTAQSAAAGIAQITPAQMLQQMQAYAQNARNVALAQMRAAALQNMGYFIFDEPERPKPPLKREGIVAGEIVGYRCWRVEKELLRSVYQTDVWEPDCVLEGRELGDWDSRGIHAWKDPSSRQYHEYIRSYLSSREELFFVRTPCDDDPRLPAMVTGTVFLWGDVVEHERGWRAEFARVRSLDWLYPGATMMGREQQELDRLRKLYGLA